MKHNVLVATHSTEWISTTGSIRDLAAPVHPEATDEVLVDFESPSTVLRALMDVIEQCRGDWYSVIYVQEVPLPPDVETLADNIRVLEDAHNLPRAVVITSHAITINHASELVHSS